MTFVLGWIAVALSMMFVWLFGAKYAAFGPTLVLLFYSVFAILLIRRHTPKLETNLLVSHFCGFRSTRCVSLPVGSLRDTSRHQTLVD